MMLPNPAISVGQCVVRYPETAPVFEEFGIDYCFRGARSVECACRENQIDSEYLLRRLEQQIESVDPNRRSRWSDATLAELCDTLEWEHEQIIHILLPEILAEAEDMSVEDGLKHADWMLLEQLLVALQTSLESHFRQEESELFPAIREVEYSCSAPGQRCVSAGELCRTFQDEHSHIGAQVQNIQKITSALDPVAMDYPKCRSLLDAINQLHRVLHQHLHKENNILFPRAVRMEMCTGSL